MCSSDLTITVNAGGKSGTSNPFDVNTLQYQVTFQQSGLSGDASGTVLTVGSTTYTQSQLPLTSIWVADGTTFSYTGTVSAGATKQYVLTGVTGGLTSPIHSSGTATGNYKTQYQVAFAVSPVGGGSTTPSTATWYDAGVGGQSISASANPSYVFSSWSANPPSSITFVSTTLPSTTMTVNGAGTITANFAVAQLQVTFVSAGTGSGSTNGNPTPGYPTGLQANDLILLQVTVRGDSTPTITPPAGFTLLYGPDATGGQSSRVTQWIYYKFSTGAETGTGTVTVTNTNFDRAARMYAFRNVALTSFTEGASFGSGQGEVILAQSVATSGNKRLAISFVSVQNDISVGSFTGESGGDWTEAAEFQFNGDDDDLVMQLQTATMATGGTISGGSYDMGSSYRYGVRAFALKPIT